MVGVDALEAIRYGTSAVDTLLITQDDEWTASACGTLLITLAVGAILNERGTQLAQIRGGVDAVRIIGASAADSRVDACQTVGHRQGTEPALIGVIKAVGFITCNAGSI